MFITTIPFPALTTNRLVLRALDTADRDHLLALRSNKVVNEYLERDKSPTLTDIDDFIIKIGRIVKNKEGLYWVIIIKDSTCLIGTLCYYNLDREKNMAELGYELHPQYQGKGIMQEALTEVIWFGWNEMQLKGISAITHPHNKSSTKLLVKLGFNIDADNKFVSKENADGLLAYVLIK